MQDEQLETMSFGSHLEVLRQMLLRVAGVVLCLSAVVFCLKDETFGIILAPKASDFVTFRLIEHVSDWLSAMTGWDCSFRFEPYQLKLISTELSAQFMMHLTTSVGMGALLASPYILYELFRFISPALYANERRYSMLVCVSCYIQFVIGVLMTYYILAPISFRFLGTYQVSADIVNTITLDSYISTFINLTFTMGLVFQLPAACWLLARLGLLKASLMRKYRRHALVAIMIVAAIITPPDVFTLLLVTIPLYALYEICIHIVAHQNARQEKRETVVS